MLHSSFQVDVLSQPTPRDSTGVLQQLSCSSAFLLNQRVGREEGAGFHKLCGSMSGCGGGAGASMPASRHHKDGVQGNSLDIPLRCCEYMQEELVDEYLCNISEVVFFFFFLIISFLLFAGSGFQDCNERRRNHS